jgi:predicted nucleotidyltransferase
MYCEEVYRALNKNRIRYLVIGGIAVNLYGLTRLTRDLDLMIDLSEKSFNKFIKVIQGLGFETKIPQSKWNKLAAIAFINKNDETERIDVFLKTPTDFESAYKRRRIFVVDGLRISCISFDDLIQMKSKGERIRDWLDLGFLKRKNELK